MDDLADKIIENKKTVIIILIVAAVIIASYFIYKKLTDYSINLELTQEEIKVNLYDTIDVKSYLTKVTDNKGNDLKSNVEIEVENDDIDVLNGSELSICGNGSKIVYYTLEKQGLVVQKKLVIKVVIDPNDKAYKPNLEGNPNCPVIQGNAGEEY